MNTAKDMELNIKKIKILGSYVTPTPPWVESRCHWTPFLMGREVGTGRLIYVALPNKASDTMSLEDMVFEANREYVPGEVTKYFEQGARRWVPKTEGRFGALWEEMLKE